MKRLIKTLFAFGTVLLACSVPSQAAKGGKPGGGGGGDNPAIAYIGDFTGGYNHGSLKLMDADGNNQRVLLKQSAKFSFIGYPTWHPNGQQIIFTYGLKSHEGAGIYRINLDGSGLTAILPPPPENGHDYVVCDVSSVRGSNGKYRIAFQELLPGYWGDFRINGVFVINEDGTGPVVQVAPTLSSPASWSPDGAHLTYTHQPRDASGNIIGPQGLYLVTLGEDENGTVWPIDDRILLDSDTFGGYFSNVSFSRTRNTIYFSSRQSGVNTIWALHLDDDMNPIDAPELLTVTALTGGIFGLSASADDTTIVFAANNPDVPSIFITGTNGSGGIIPICNIGSYPSFKR